MYNSKMAAVCKIAFPLGLIKIQVIKEQLELAG
jgi:hypothetical protein